MLQSAVLLFLNNVQKNTHYHRIETSAHKCGNFLPAFEVLVGTGKEKCSSFNHQGEFLIPNCQWMTVVLV